MTEGRDFETAHEVSEYLLKVTGDSMMNNDFDTFSSAFHLPHTITTFEATSVLRTLKDMRRVFCNVRAHYIRIGVTQLVRYSVAATFKTPDRVEATHVAHLMNGARQLAEPSSVFSVLERIERRWQITSSQYAIADLKGHSRALIISASPDTDTRQTGQADETGAPSAIIPTHPTGRHMQ